MKILSLVFAFVYIIILFPSEETAAFQLPRLSKLPSHFRGNRILCTKVDNASNITPNNNLLTANMTISMPSPSLGVSKSPRTSSTTSNKLIHKYLPVYRNEITKFLSLSTMMMLIVFVFSLTRDTKDVLIVTNCGAEAIAFLKVYGVIPAATLFMIAYSMLANRYPLSTLFYIVLAPFFAFFFLFGFFLYPYRNIIHPLQMHIPNSGLSYAFQLVKYWSFSLYYIVSELWGSASIPLLFWSCANEITNMKQAKRLYPLISLVGNLGPIFSGLIMTIVSSLITKKLSISAPGNDEKAFEMSLKILTVIMLVAGGCIAALHSFVRSLPAATTTNTPTSPIPSISTNTNITTDSTVTTTNTTTTNSKEIQKKSKPKLSFFQSIEFLAKNNYLKQVAIMVLAYGLSIEFTEILWKAIVKKAFPVKTDYLQFMGKYSTYVGISSMVMMFVGNKVVEMIGWKGGALLSPMIMAFFAIPFFGLLMLLALQPNGGFLGLSLPTKLTAIVYIGLILNVLTKGSKYAVFDPIKEMAYIPLDHESKSKGKAAIDVLGARLGKAGGAFLLQGIVVGCGDLFKGVPLVSLLFYALIGSWTNAVYQLAPQVENLSSTTASSPEATQGEEKSKKQQ